MAGLGDIMGMMREFGAMRARMAQVQEELGRETFQGEAGGGLVVATINGRQELVALKIDPAVVNREDAALLEEMVKGAVGQAMVKARDKQREAMTKVLGGLPIPPGLMDMLA